LQRNPAHTDRAQTLGNFALASAAARDWPQRLQQLKEGPTLRRLQRFAAPCVGSRINLLPFGDLKNGLAELLEAQKLAPNDADIEQAIRMIQIARNSISREASGKGPPGFLVRL